MKVRRFNLKNLKYGVLRLKANVRLIKLTLFGYFERFVRTNGV